MVNKNNEGRVAAPPAKAGMPQKSRAYRRGWRQEITATSLTAAYTPRVDKGREKSQAWRYGASPTKAGGLASLLSL